MGLLVESHPHTRLTKFLPTQAVGWYNRWMVKTCEKRVPRLQGSFAALRWSVCMWSCRTGTICMCMWNKIECRWAKFNNYPKYKSQLLAKTCPRRSTTSWNKEQWKKLTEQSEWQYRKYCTSNAKKALVQNLVDFDFLFSMIFDIFLSTSNTRIGTTPSFTWNREQMWSTENQTGMPKSVLDRNWIF